MFVEIYSTSEQTSEWNFIFQENNFFFPYKLINSIVLGKICLLNIQLLPFSYFYENEGIIKFVTGSN